MMRLVGKKIGGRTDGFGDVSINFLTMEIHKAGKLVALTAHEFKLLRFFLDNPGRVCRPRRAAQRCLGLNFHLTPPPQHGANQILKLRQKL